MISLAASARILAFKATPVALTSSLTNTFGTIALRVYSDTAPVILSTLKFSLDGVSFSDITLVNPPDLSSLQGSQQGQLLNLTWDLYADMEANYLNVPIYIKAGLSDGSHFSQEVVRTFTISRVTVDLSAKPTPIPASVVGNPSKVALPNKKEL